MKKIFLHSKKKYTKLKYFFFAILLFIFLISSNIISSQEDSLSDTDSDGVHDIYEDFLGSNSNNSSDAKEILISGSNYYLINTNGDEFFDIFFDVSLCRYNDLEKIDGILYIDSNFDKEWDYTYDNTLEPIKDSFDFSWLLVIGIIIFVIILIIAILFRTGILYLYEEEYVVED